MHDGQTTRTRAYANLSAVTRQLYFVGLFLLGAQLWAASELV